MTNLTKQQAEKICEITSQIFLQGTEWVMQEHDLESGVVKLTRGLTQKGAERRLSGWRKEKVEQLLRSNGTAPAYALRTWYENPDWNGAGVWRWHSNYWYTTLEDAQSALNEKIKASEKKFEVYETNTASIPGHFVVA